VGVVLVEQQTPPKKVVSGSAVLGNFTAWGDFLVYFSLN